MRFMLTALLLILFIESSGQSTGNKIKISNLTGGFYVYTNYKELNNTLFPSNSMYLVTDKGVVLFDTPTVLNFNHCLTVLHQGIIKRQ